MNYRNLLVHLDTGPACAVRVNQAIELALAMECHLVGLASTGLVSMPVIPESAAAMGDFMDQAWELLLDHAQQAAGRFTAACAVAGLKSSEVVVDRADVAMSLVRHAHCSDLVIVGQPDPGRSDRREQRAMVEQVVLHSARPTLILPYAGRIETLGTRPLVAWDDSREAARAVGDALPLLRRADEVQIVSWREDEHSHARRSLGPLKQWLAWHGVAAQMHEESTGLPIAEALLSRAADCDSDLIVMGAYGHSRWTERVLGGATLGILDAMTVPVLMSH